jgi:hypothetical protein
MAFAMKDAGCPSLDTSVLCAVSPIGTAPFNVGIQSRVVGVTREYEQKNERQHMAETRSKPKPKKKPRSRAPIVVTFVRERETRTTQRFEEEAPKDDRLIGYVYVKKKADDALGNPERLQMTLEAAP